MFLPNVRATVVRRKGTDIYGKIAYAAPESILCGVVRLEEMSGATSVRTDSSASRGSAMEETLNSRILVPAKTRLTQGDKVILAGFTMTVESVWPRYAINGTLDHWQIDLVINADQDSVLKLN